MPATVGRVSLTATSTGTRMAITATFPETEAKEQLAAMGMVEGMSEALTQIEGILAEG